MSGRGSFFFVTNDVEFEEGQRGARISCTFMELDTPSQNGRIYRFVEGLKIAQSLVGRSIRYGANWLGKHLKKVPVIGVVEKAFQEGKKIKGIVRIWDDGIIETLKKGTRYLFSVGGVADFEKYVRRGAKLFRKLFNAVCTHLQLLPNDPKGAGFPSAKMHKVIEINESLIYVEDRTVKVCDEFGCKILRQIRSEFEESLEIKRAVRESIIRKAVEIGSEKVLEYY